MASPRPSWNSPLLLPLLPVAMRSSSISTAGSARHSRRGARVRPPLRSQRTLADAAFSPGPAGLLGVAGDGRCHRGARRHRPASPPLSPDAPAREVGDEPDRRAPRVGDPVGGPARLSGDGFRCNRLSRAKAYFHEAASDVAPARVRPSRWAGPVAPCC